jgi:hypothetical protein
MNIAALVAAAMVGVALGLPVLGPALLFGVVLKVFLGVIGVSVAAGDRHQLIDGHDRHLSAPELLHQRIELIVLFEDQDGSVGVDAVVGEVLELGPAFEPMASRLPIFLYAPPQVLDGGGAFAGAFEILDEGSAHLLP